VEFVDLQICGIPSFHNFHKVHKWKKDRYKLVDAKKLSMKWAIFALSQSAPNKILLHKQPKFSCFAFRFSLFFCIFASEITTQNNQLL